MNLLRSFRQLFIGPRCDMERCDNPKHGRVHFQKGSGRPYVPTNLIVQSVLERPETRALRALGRVGLSTAQVLKTLTPKCAACVEGIIEGAGGPRPCALCSSSEVSEPVYQIGGPC